MKKENVFQRELKKEIKTMYPDAIVLKVDSVQGIPDLLILKDNKWASLECKRTINSTKRPNQEYYVDKLNRMSFSKFICPENKKEILYELQQTFGD